MSEQPGEFYFEYDRVTQEYGQLSNKPPYVRDTSMECVHVIEKSFYDAVVVELEKFENAHEEIVAANINMSKELSEYDGKYGALMAEAQALAEQVMTSMEATYSLYIAKEQIQKSIDRWNKFLKSREG